MPCSRLFRVSCFSRLLSVGGPAKNPFLAQKGRHICATRHIVETRTVSKSIKILPRTVSKSSLGLRHQILSPLVRKIGRSLSQKRYHFGPGNIPFNGSWKWSSGLEEHNMLSIDLGMTWCAFVCYSHERPNTLNFFLVCYCKQFWFRFDNKKWLKLVGPNNLLKSVYSKQ